MWNLMHLSAFSKHHDICFFFLNFKFYSFSPFTSATECLDRLSLAKIMRFWKPTIAWVFALFFRAILRWVSQHTCLIFFQFIYFIFSSKVDRKRFNAMILLLRRDLRVITDLQGNRLRLFYNNHYRDTDGLTLPNCLINWLLFCHCDAVMKKNHCQTKIIVFKQ